MRRLAREMSNASMRGRGVRGRGGGSLSQRSISLIGTFGHLIGELGENKQ